MGLQTSETAWLVGGIFALLAVFLSSWEIYRPLTHWYIPSQQKWVIRVMLIVPVGLSLSLSLTYTHIHTQTQTNTQTHTNTHMHIDTHKLTHAHR